MGAVTDLRLAPRTGREVRVRAPGKVNLSLRVGSRRPDGYHPVATVFQAVSLYEDVVASPSDGLEVTVSGPQAAHVPTDGSNLALRAARALAERTGIDEGVHLHLHKGVPVAGGMAGGSPTPRPPCSPATRSGAPRSAARSCTRSPRSSAPTCRSC